MLLANLQEIPLKERYQFFLNASIKGMIVSFSFFFIQLLFIFEQETKENNAIRLAEVEISYYKNTPENELQLLLAKAKKNNVKLTLEAQNEKLAVISKGTQLLFLASGVLFILVTITWFLKTPKSQVQVLDEDADFSNNEFNTLIRDNIELLPSELKGLVNENTEFVITISNKNKLK